MKIYILINVRLIGKLITIRNLKSHKLANPVCLPLEIHQSAYSASHLHIWNCKKKLRNCARLLAIVIGCFSFGGSERITKQVSIV